MAEKQSHDVIMAQIEVLKGCERQLVSGIVAPIDWLDLRPIAGSTIWCRLYVQALG